jgi:hypothetical protein
VSSSAAKRKGRGTNLMTAGHFIFIPSVLLVGIIIGWVLGSRAARDAFAVELRRREEREKSKAEKLRTPRGTNTG